MVWLRNKNIIFLLHLAKGLDIIRHKKQCSAMSMIFHRINFSSPILDFDFSPNGKYVITVAEDRSIMLWSAKEFEQKEHK